MVKKYISNSVMPFKAIQWDGTNESDVIDFVGIKNVVLVDHEHKLIVFKSFDKKEVAEVGNFIRFTRTPFGRIVTIIKEEDFNFYNNEVTDFDDYVEKIREAFRKGAWFE